MKFLLGVIAGGAAVALLTPMSGDKLRAKIADVLRQKGLLPDRNADDVVEMIAAELEEKQQ